jgi:cytochrome c553
MNEIAAALLLCAGCHGMSGEGRPAAGYPRLAGQPQAYLQRQLEAYADGRRADVVMGPLAKRISTEERGRLAAHFAALPAPSPRLDSPSSRRTDPSGQMDFIARHLTEEDIAALAAHYADESRGD